MKENTSGCFFSEHNVQHSSTEYDVILSTLITIYLT